MIRRSRESRLLLAAGLALLSVAVLPSIPAVLAQTAPTLSSADVDGTTLTLTFSEDLTSASAAVASEFTVNLGEASQTVSSAAVSGTDVTLTLMEAVPDVDCTDDSVTVGYAPTSSSLVGTNGGTVEAFADQAVTNSTNAAPAIVSSETDITGRYAYVTFCEAITAFGSQWSDFSAFTVERDGTRVDVNDLRRLTDTPTRLRLDLTSNKRRWVQEGETVTVAYDSSKANEDDPFADADQGNQLVASWAARSVTNQVDSPPTLTTVTALYDVVTLTFSEALDEGSVPEEDVFSIAGISDAPEVDDVSISGDTVTLTLDKVLLSRNTPTYTFSYSEPNSSPLRQADGAHNVSDISSFQFMSSTPDTRPMVDAAEVDGATLTISFDLPLKAVAPASAFAVAGEDGISVSGSSFSGSVVTLTLSPAVSAGSTITVSYTAPDNPPRIEGRNARDAETFSGHSVTNNTAAPAPEFDDASVSANGAELTITFSLALNTSSAGLPDKSTFSLAGTSASVESLSIDGSSVSLKLSPLADVNEAITVSYTPPTDAMDPRLQSSAHGKAVAAFANESVTNNADGKPRPLSALADGDEVAIAFDRDLDDQSEPAVSSFAIGGVSATVSDVAISGKDLTLTISPAVTHLDTITIGYASPMENPLKRQGSSLLVDSFSGQSVTNNTEDPTPKYGSASVDATGRTLTIVMSHPLLATSAGIPAASTFTLSGSTQARVESVTLDGSSIELTLKPAADLNETVSVGYVPPTDPAASALQSPDGRWKTPAWANESVTNNADGVPRLLGGTADADSITLDFDRTLDDSSVPPASDFSVTPADQTVSDVDVDGNTVTLTLSAALAHDDVVTVSYSAVDTVKLMRDGQALKVAAFNAIEVTNQTPEPLLSSIVGDQDAIVLTFLKMLDTTSQPDSSAFSLGENQPAVNGVTVASMTVTLSLATALSEGGEYTLTYTAPSVSPLQTSDASAVPDFTESVTNNTDVAPTALSATGNGSTISIEFDQALNADSVVEANRFSITADTAVSVTGVSFDQDSLDMTLSRALVEDESVSISYSKPTQAGIADSSGNRTDSFMLAIDNQTDTAPVPVSGVFEGDTITVVLDQDLAAVSLFDLDLEDDSVVLDHFTLMGTDAEATNVIRVVVSNNGPNSVGKIVITLSRDTKEGEELSLRYFPDSGSIRIRDDDAGQNRAEINNYALTNLNDEPPVVESATVDGVELVITFDQDLDEDSKPEVTAFSLSNKGPATSMTSISGKELTLTLESTAIEDQEYELTYTPPASGALRDLTGNDAVGFMEDVENLTDYAPFPESIKTDKDGVAVFVKFDQTVEIPNGFEDSSFGLGPSVGIHSVIVDPDILDGLQLRLILESSSPIREGATVKLTYTQPLSGGLRDDDAGNLVAAFSETVENLVDVAPIIESVTVNGQTIQIQFDQELDPKHEPPPNCEWLESQIEDFDCLLAGEPTWFTVQRNEMGSETIESVAVNGATVSLQLVERVSRTDKVAFAYQPNSFDDSSRNLRDTSEPANQVENIGPVMATNITAAYPTLASLNRSTPNTISVRFDGPLATETALRTDLVVVTVDGVRAAAKNVSTSGSTLLIRLSTPVPECVDVRIGYSSEDGDWKDGSGRAIDEFNLPVDNFINADWKLQCVRSDVGGLVLTFADPALLNRQGFQWNLKVDGEEREPSVSTEDGVVELRPQTSICAGDSVEVRYSDGNEAEALVPTRTIAQAAPCVVSAVADGVLLRVTFDGPLHSSPPDARDFALTGGIAVVAIEGIAGSVLTIRLAAPGIPAGEVASLTYSGDSLTGSGLTVAPFTVSVSDRTPPPELESAFAVDSSIFLNFDQPLISRVVPVSRFIPTGPGIEQRVKAVSVGGSSVYLELSEPLRDEPDLFGLVYLAGARAGLAGLTGSRVPDSVFLVQNYTETPPSVLSATIDGVRLQVVFDQRIHANEALSSDFSVVAGRRSIAVESLKWSKSGVTITLTERVTSLDAVAFVYTPGPGRNVRDTSNLPLAALLFQVENETPEPTTRIGRVDDARLRASSGDTTLERELARGFASDDRLQVSLAPGEGWTTAIRGRLKASVDVNLIGGTPVRIYVALIQDLAAMLPHVGFVPWTCWNKDHASMTVGWWIGESDLLGVPTDIGVPVRVAGVFDAFRFGSVCILDLITGKWRFHPPGRPVVGPALVLIRETPVWFNWDRLPLAG